MFLRGLAHEGVHSFVQAYPDDAPFLGRARELEQLQKFASGTAAHGLLCAPAGRGKSALLLRLVRALDAAGHAVAWAPISLRFGTHRSLTVDELLTARLRALLSKSGHWRDLITGHDGPPLLLAIDGLDELQDTALLDALADLPLPSSVCLLATARPLLDRDAAAWSARLRWISCDLFDLPPLARHEVSAALPPRPGKRWMDTLMHHTGGDPLLVRICMESMDRDEPLPDVSDPTELVGAWWSDQRARLQAPQGELAARLLGALGAACGVVPWAVLASVVGASEEQAREALLPFARFVIEVPTQGVTFAHPRFAEVARWTFATATQDAHQRFAALALEARQQANPDPYFLHFALPHLEAAGASDEAFDALVSARSLAAWQQHEGSAHGFLREVHALQRRNAHQLSAAWGTDALPAALQRQARLSFLSAVLQGGMIELEPAFLVELVRHGLRSTSQALQLVSEMPANKQPHALRWLLPLLPDSALPAFLAIYSDDQEFVDRTLLQRLLQADLWTEAQAYLGQFKRLPTSMLVALAPSLSPTQTERLRGLIEAQLSTEPGYPSLHARLVRLPLLPPGEQEAELSRCEALLQSLQEAPSDEPHGWHDVACTSILMEEAARLGQGAFALRWLHRCRERDEAARAAHPTRTDQRLHLFFNLWKLLAGRERDEATAVAAQVLQAYPPSKDWLQQHASCAPADFPWRTVMPQRPPEPTTDMLLRPIDEAYERHVTLPLRERATDQAWDKALRSLWHLSLPSPAPLFERLPRWLATRVKYGRSPLLSAMVQNATTEETRAQVRGWLADGTVQADDWLWEDKNWLHILPTEERVAILRDRLRQPPDPIRHSGLVLQAMPHMAPEQDREAMETLLMALGRVAPEVCLNLTLNFDSFRALVEPHELDALLTVMANSTESIALNNNQRLVDQLLRLGASRAPSLQLARALLKQLAHHPLPWFPVETTALSMVPPEEARAWVQRCCARPESETTDLIAWSNSTARWRPEELATLTRGPATENSPLDHAACLLERLPRPFWPQLIAQPPRHLTPVLKRLGATSLLLVAPQMIAAGATDHLLEWLTERTLTLLHQGSPEQTSLEALLCQLAPPGDPHPEPSQRRPLSLLLAWLWWNRHLPPGKRAIWMCDALQAWRRVDIADLVDNIHTQDLREAFALALKEGQLPAVERLEAWSLLWDKLTAETQTALQAPITEVTYSLQSADKDGASQSHVASWALARLEPAAMHEVWLRESAQPRRNATFPLEALRRIGGAEAVAAWARGVAEALNTVAAESEDGARS